MKLAILLSLIGLAVALTWRFRPEPEHDDYLSEASLRNLLRSPQSAVGWGRLLKEK